MAYRDMYQRRIRAMVGITIVLLVVIALRLVDVQAVEASSISKRATNEMMMTSTLLAPRGEITDVNGVELARSVDAITIVVDQTMIADPATTANVISPILNMPAPDLVTLLTGTKRYQIIAKNVTPAVWQNLQSTLTTYNRASGLSKRIVGFFSERGYVRQYPTGKLAASLVGITNAAGVGASGIETSLNSKLSGTNGEYLYANGAGTIIPGSAVIKTEAKAGTSVQLTINRDIEWVAQDAIAAAVKSAKAASGTVIVMDPKTGRILAEASAPSFDPSIPKTITQESLRNPAVQDAYEPGSTGKVITLSAALEEKTVTPTSVFTVPYSLKVVGGTFHDAEHHGTEHLTATGVLAQSSNVGTIQIGGTMAHDTLYSYLKKFGIGASTGSGLPGEQIGQLPPVAQWSASSAPTIAFGQGYSVTALQATSVMATIANDGVRVSPTVIAGTTDSSGHYAPAANQTSTRVVSSSTAAAIRTMLESVVSQNGTAPAAAIPGYRVAGKTGTAQRSDPTCHCYRGYTSSFIGFAPADKPAYVVSVVIQNPQGQHFGGVIAAPVFQKVMSFVLQTQHIQPTGGKPTPYPLTAAELSAATK
jgi:cell division protein FtsI (penicillin-binding protein 3)